MSSPTTSERTGLPSTETPVVRPKPVAIDDRMVRQRLGVYVSLFYALKAKHPSTADHSLRVALGCSKWARWRNLSAEQCDFLEIAALLHDLGKIAVPDDILQKPAKLTEHEMSAMEKCRSLADYLLAKAGAKPELIQIVRAARSRHEDAVKSGIANPLASMLGIVDAFDSMTTEQVFRRAMSPETALEELCANASSQFDPSLVQDFAVLVSQPRQDLELAIAKRWLSELQHAEQSGFGEPPGPDVTQANPSAPVASSLERVFHQRFLDSMTDAAVYLDRQDQVLKWNYAAEQLVGRQARTVLHRKWTPEVMGLLAADGSPLPEDRNPLRRLRETNTQLSENFLLQNVHGQQYTVQLRAIPVISPDRENCGTIMLARDASKQVKLERQVESLHRIATSDPLTKVANRAELTRRTPEFLERHLSEGRPGSLIICDIDFFKRINDNYGHQAGDEALVTFAGLLSELAREDDLVARYGGEEFVILCEGCDNSAATNRAEEIRKKIESTPVPALKNKNMTSSFGVTEIQHGDSAETLMARADRALLMAKENGRNRVVQLGAGQDLTVSLKDDFEPNAARERGTSWMNWFSSSNTPMVAKDFLAAVPREVAVQKLEGFIHDHGGDVESIEDGLIVVRLRCCSSDVRKGDRPCMMLMRVVLTEVQVTSEKMGRTSYQNRTMFNVSILPHRSRDRRKEAVLAQAKQLLVSFQAYLVAQAIDDEMRATIIEPR